MKAIFLLFALAACGAQPAPQMFGAVRSEVARDGRNYVVFQKGKQVEIIRLGWASPGQHQQIRADMIALIPQVTGCRLVPSTLQGDSGEMRGRLVCPR
tara:strand:- start:198 stop:491 length:294 start_codon:yes stop_codon:yes gene_type:complete